MATKHEELKQRVIAILDDARRGNGTAEEFDDLSESVLHILGGARLIVELKMQADFLGDAEGRAKLASEMRGFADRIER
jgi:hypothetical protein